METQGLQIDFSEVVICETVDDLVQMLQNKILQSAIPNVARGDWEQLMWLRPHDQ